MNSSTRAGNYLKRVASTREPREINVIPDPHTMGRIPSIYLDTPGAPINRSMIGRDQIHTPRLPANRAHSAESWGHQGVTVERNWDLLANGARAQIVWQDTLTREDCPKREWDCAITLDDSARTGRIGHCLGHSCTIWNCCLITRRTCAGSRRLPTTQTLESSLRTASCRQPRRIQVNTGARRYFSAENDPA